jgi:Ran GTPase-activating protein (RanGAP) involved in mRNA processing and transport
VLSDNSTLTHLGLERNEIGMACRAMASGLQANQTLEVSTLHSLFGDGIPPEYGILTSVPLLIITAQVLDLSRNTLGSEMKWDNDDWKDLAEALAKHKSLTHLDLSYNGLRREECMMLGKDLEANHVCIGE